MCEALEYIKGIGIAEGFGKGEAVGFDKGQDFERVVSIRKIMKNLNVQYVGFGIPPSAKRPNPP